MNGADTIEREPRKRWSDLAALAALHGLQAWRSDAADGPQRFFLGRFGLIRVCADLDELERVIERA